MTGLFAPVGSFDMVGLLNLLDYFDRDGSFYLVGLFNLNWLI